MSNSVVPNSFNGRNSVVPNSMRVGGNSRVQGRGGGVFDPVYMAQRGPAQVAANRNNTANSHFNVAHKKLMNAYEEYNNYLQELNRKYGTPHMIPNANRQQVKNRMNNILNKVSQAHKSYLNASAFK